MEARQADVAGYFSLPLAGTFIEAPTSASIFRALTTISPPSWKGFH